MSDRSSASAILFAFVRRDWRIDLSYRAAFGLRAVSLLLSLTLFYYLGQVIDQNAYDDQQGVTADAGYFGYVAIGLATFTVVQTSLVSFSRKLREEQTTGTFEALMTTPASPSLIILSSAVYEIVRATIDGFLILLAAVLIFGLRLDTSPDGIAVALATLVGALALFASLGVAVAALTVLFKRTTALLALIMSAIALLSGVYFPIDVLPSAIQTIAGLIPFTWTLDLLRVRAAGRRRRPRAPRRPLRLGARSAPALALFLQLGLAPRAAHGYPRALLRAGSRATGAFLRWPRLSSRATRDG